MAAGAGAEIRWELWYRDSFDGEDPPSVDERGDGLAEGLARLWTKTLHEGISENDGSATFSRFWLAWAGGSTSIPVPLFARKDPAAAALAKLRSWVFPVRAPCTPAREDDRTDGCPTAPHEIDDRLLHRLGELHLGLLRSDDPSSSAAAAKRIIELASNARSPEDLRAAVAPPERPHHQR